MSLYEEKYTITWSSVKHEAFGPLLKVFNAQHCSYMGLSKTEMKWCNGNKYNMTKYDAYEPCCLQLKTSKTKSIMDGALKGKKYRFNGSCNNKQN